MPFDTDATIPGVSGIMRQLLARGDVIAVSPVLGAQLHVEHGSASVSAAALGTIAAVQGVPNSELRPSGTTACANEISRRAASCAAGESGFVARS